MRTPRRRRARRRRWEMRRRIEVSASVARISQATSGSFSVSFDLKRIATPMRTICFERVRSIVYNKRQMLT
jgi:hypothetical protein